MKKPGLIIFIFVLIFFGAMIGLTYISHFNKIAKLEQSVKAQWANVEGAYQRRLDLIPNAVKTLKAEANFEKSTLTAVMEARAKATSITVDPTKLNPETITKFQSAQTELSSAIGRLLMVTENYPDLKTNQDFQMFQAELAGTENRINVERMKFNDAVKVYNTFINKMFQKWFFGSKQEMGYFQADAQASKAPELNFDN